MLISCTFTFCSVGREPWLWERDGSKVKRIQYGCAACVTKPSDVAARLPFFYTFSPYRDRATNCSKDRPCPVATTRYFKVFRGDPYVTCHDRTVNWVHDSRRVAPANGRSNFKRSMRAWASKSDYCDHRERRRALIR